MNQLGWVQITDREGWRKEFPLDRRLVHIGSAGGNDIVLDTMHGSGVAPRHLQLIAGADGQHYRAINLGDSDVLLEGIKSASVSPRSAVQIVDGESLRLGDFVLEFHLTGMVASPPAPVAGREVAAAGEVHGAPTTRAQEASAVIGLGLSLPVVGLHPDRPLEGVVTVQNLGDEPGVQFILELEGVEADCYELGPGPILFPSVEKGVKLRLHHPRGPEPAAGRYPIRIRATAPEAYPGEAAVVTREIQILPYYRHELRLEPAD